MRSEECDKLLAGELDRRYRDWIGARALVIQQLRQLLRATCELGRAIGQARADLRLPFHVWCGRYCRVLDVKMARPVEGVAHRTHVEGRIETWQLRLLGVVSAIHHAARPVTERRRPKRVSWLTHISRSHEEVGKLIERAGGVSNIPVPERQAILRQIGSFEVIRAKLNGGQFR